MVGRYGPPDSLCRGGGPDVGQELGDGQEAVQSQRHHQVTVDLQPVALQGLEGEDQEGDKETGQGDHREVDVDAGNELTVHSLLVICHCGVLENRLRSGFVREYYHKKDCKIGKALL